MRQVRKTALVAWMAFAVAACGGGSNAGIESMDLPDVGVDGSGAQDPGPGDSTGDDVASGSETTGPADVSTDPGPPCSGAGDCDDDDPCTKDTCDGGFCAHVALRGCESCKKAGDCSDGDGCTQDKCTDQICLHVPLVDDCVDCEATGKCDDGNDCTKDTCLVEGFCEFECDCIATCLTDDDCFTDDQCAPTTCQVTKGTGLCHETACVSKPKDCDDSDPCTEDSCDPASVECVHESIPGCGDCTTDQDCDDSDPCTDDVCDDAAGKCKHGKIDCDDGDPCTTDFCQGAVGCKHLDICYHCDNDSECDDKDPCTEDTCDHEANDTCSNVPMDCDDGCDCTIDSCDPSQGCVHSPDPACPPACIDDADCDDMDACTLDSCDFKDCVGECHNVGVDCDDSSVCTLDSCDPDTGCVHEELTGACSDGDACTAGDECVGGACISGAPLFCEDDGNPCTDDYCDHDLGCVSNPHDGPCEDGDQCTSNDTCVQGECVGTKVDCNDGNACTSDYCGNDIGCYYTFNVGTPCSDGNACTTTDKCNNVGVCVPGPAPNCDDGVKCTKDWCDTSVGCINALDTDDCNCDNNDGKCEDHDPNTKTCCKWVKWWQAWDAWRCVVNDC